MLGIINDFQRNTPISSFSTEEVRVRCFKRNVVETIHRRSGFIFAVCYEAGDKMFCILIRLDYITNGIKILSVVKFNEILCIASTEDERNISIIFHVFKNDVLIYLPSVPNFEINIKSRYIESFAVQTSRFDSTHKTIWKALNKYKKNWISLSIGAHTLKKRRSPFDLESNDAKVSPLEIAARADCARVKLINGVPRRFRPNWITYALCLQIRSSDVQHRPEVRVWLMQVDLSWPKKKKGRTRKKGAARPHTRKHAFGSKSSRKQSAASTDGDLQQTARCLLAFATRDYDDQRE